MPKVFFTSDSHYSHKNIIKKLSDWSSTDQCRDFNSIPEMNDALVEGINSVVGPSDTLYHLGDFNFGSEKNLYEFRARIKSNDIHLIIGNHDFKHGTVDPQKFAGLFTSIQHYKEIVVAGQEIILSHYAFRVWNRQSKGSWHLYGHSHGMLPQVKNFSLDVGVDAKPMDLVDGKIGLRFNSVPWSFEQIQLWFRATGHKIKCEDSHDKSENSRPLK